MTENERNETAARVLDYAATLIDGGWTQLAEARDQHGNRCMATSPEAVCFCATGAMRRATRILVGPATTEKVCAIYSYIHRVMRVVIAQFGYTDIERWNDALHQRTRTEVAAGLRAGAAACRG